MKSSVLTLTALLLLCQCVSEISGQQYDDSDPLVHDDWDGKHPPAPSGAIYGKLRPEYDIIIVGMGTTGAIVTANLVEKFPNLSILVLEAGPRLSADVGGDFRPPYVAAVNGTDTYFDVPAEYSHLSFYGLGREYMDKEVPFTSQGIGWGGNSMFNGMWVQVPAPDEFDEAWPENWKFKDVEPYFYQMMDKTEIVDDPSKGSRGPSLQSAFEITTKLFEAMNATLKPSFRIYESDYDEYSPPYVTARGGRRASPVQDWLVPVLKKNPPNLTIVSLARAERLLFSQQLDGTLRAVGVEYLKRTQVEDLLPERVGIPQIATLKRSGRIVLCTGALKTPKILYMSGVAESPEAHARVFQNISEARTPQILLQVPELGRVFDHVGCQITIRDTSGQFKAFHVADYNANTDALKTYTSSHAGPYSIYGPVQSVRMRVNPEPTAKADVEAFAIPNGVGPINSTYSGPHDFSLIFQLLNTTTRNRVVLDENEFLAFTLISQNNESLKDDLHLAKGVFKVLKTLKTMPNLQIVLGPGGVSHPKLDPSKLKDVEEYAKGVNNPLPNYIYFANLLINHFGGTAALGKAVDEYTMKLKGTANVHIAGASVMPLPIGAHPIFTIMMVAERASDMIAQQIHGELDWDTLSSLV
jgi:choline dehydrogenase